MIGVEVAASCPFTQSLAAGRLVTIDVGPSLADGLTGNLDPDTITLDIVRDVVDEIVVVDEPLLRRALAGVVTHEHLVIEGAAAAGAGGAAQRQIELKGNVAVVLTGANIDAGTLSSILPTYEGLKPRSGTGPELATEDLNRKLKLTADSTEPATTTSRGGGGGGDQRAGEQAGGLRSGESSSGRSAEGCAASPVLHVEHRGDAAQLRRERGGALLALLEVAA